MASSVHGCVWTLLLAACTSLVGGAVCGKECSLCVHRLLGQQDAFSALTCSLECDGELDGQKLRLCQDLQLEQENHLALDEDARQRLEDAASTGEEDEGQASTSTEHRLAKKYGGFMKRYGGFMSRRSSPEEVPEDSESPSREDNARLEILKILNSAVEGSMGGEAAKRYGGFMRRAEGGMARGDLLEVALGRGLKKRYGGFMRRVGRPEWLLDSGKTGGGGKRAWEDGGQFQKRYGGFMD